MPLRFRARQSVRIGPPKFCIKWNFTQRGYSGWSLKIWRWTYSDRTRAHTFNTPGWGALHWGGDRQPPSRRARR